MKTSTRRAYFFFGGNLGVDPDALSLLIVEFAWPFKSRSSFAATFSTIQQTRPTTVGMPAGV